MNELLPVPLLTEDSLDKLKVVAMGPDAATIWESDLDELVGMYELKVFDSDYRINPAAELVSSQGDSSIDDAVNAQVAVNALPGLSRADSVDERLWVTLALGAFRAYTHERWPVRSSDIDRHLQNHIFIPTVRNRERDQAISRLWFVGDFARRYSPDHLVLPTLQALYVNSDLAVQFFGRPNLSSVENIARASLNAFRTCFVEEGVEYDRAKFRLFLSHIDMLAGRRALGTLSDSDADELMQSNLRKYMLE